MGILEDDQEYQLPMYTPAFVGSPPTQPESDFAQLFYRPMVESSQPTETPDAVRQGFGVIRDPYVAAASVASQSAMTHQDKAMQLMREALNGGNGVSDEQATQAAIRGLIPALGGALLGGIIGKPNLSPHAKLSMQDLQNSPTGLAGGLQLGVVAGEKDSNQYLNDLKAQQAKQDAVNTMMARNELEQGTIEQRQANELTAGGLNKQAQMEINNQNNEAIGAREIELERMKEAHDTLIHGPKAVDPVLNSAMSKLLHSAATKTPPQLTPEEFGAVAADPKASAIAARLMPPPSSSNPFKMESALSKQAASGDAYKKMIDIQSTMQRVNKAMETENPATAVGIVEGFAKSLNPGFALREFATKLAEQAKGPQQAAAGQLLNYIDEAGPLTPQAKQLMLQVVRDSYIATKNTYEQSIAPLRQAVKDNNLDPSHVFPDFKDYSEPQQDPNSDPEFLAWKKQRGL